LACLLDGKFSYCTHPGITHFSTLFWFPQLINMLFLGFLITSFIYFMFRKLFKKKNTSNISEHKHPWHTRTETRQDSYLADLKHLASGETSMSRVGQQYDRNGRSLRRALAYIQTMQTTNIQKSFFSFNWGNQFIVKATSDCIHIHIFSKNFLFFQNTHTKQKIL
jgi:hypothetical protein